MREIKFRAKGIEEYDKDKWYHGYYIKLDKTTYCFKEDYERNKNNSEHKIVFDVMTDWGLPNQHKMADINIDTLGQFTGLCDKNNVEIYEGDIVKFFSGLGGKETCVIYYDERQQSLNIKNYPRGYIYDGLYNLKNKKGIEIIGNIYDNEVEE